MAPSSEYYFSCSTSLLSPHPPHTDPRQCTQSVYPFHDGDYDDFEPVFREIFEVRSPFHTYLSSLLLPSNTTALFTQQGISDVSSPSFTECFMHKAETLVEEADAIATLGEKQAASTIYLRACALYRIARFPYLTSRPRVNDPVKWQAWEAQKKAYAAAGKLWDCPLEEVDVPHEGGMEGEGNKIPIYVRFPKPKQEEGGEEEEVEGKGKEPAKEAPANKAPATKVPAVILMTGLDGYRPDNTLRCEEFLSRGW